MSTPVSDSPAAGAARRPSQPASAVVRAVLMATAAVTLVLLAFAWPTYSAKVKDMPVAVAGGEQMVAAVSQQLAGAGDAFEVRRVENRKQAVDLIPRHKVYGAIVLPAAAGGRTEFVTATAGSPAATQMLSQVAQKMAAGQPNAPAPKMTEAIPFNAKDARGAGFGLTGLPLAMGGMIGGVIISLLLVGWRWRSLGVVGYAVLGGLMLATVLHAWFGWLQGGFLDTWAILGLAIGATAAVVVGLHSLVGQPGIGLGAVLTMFVGNPLAASAMPKEWLPGPWGGIGQLFVPGAAGSLLRLESYFPRADQLFHWLVLIAWLALGLTLTVVGHHRQGRRAKAA